MGFAVIHMEKIGKGGVGGIQIHNNREKVSKSNPDIDYSKKKFNYDLVECKNYYGYINQKIKEYAVKTKTVRKDAVMMCSFVITSDEKTMKSMSKNKQREFFQDSVNFLGKRYGENNIISATVHMDETTPHMHICIVPITADGRLSAKSIFTKKELASLQTDFAKDVGSIYGLERGIEGSEKKHLTETRFKLKMAKDELKHLKNDVLEARKTLLESERELEDTKVLLEAINAEYELKKAYTDSSHGKIPSYAKKETRGILKKENVITIPEEKWFDVVATKSERKLIEKARDMLDEAIDDFNKTTSGEYIQDLNEEIDRLSEEIKKREWFEFEMQRKLEDKNNIINALQRENKDLKGELKNKDQKFNVEIKKIKNRIAKVVNKMSKEVSKENATWFVEQWNKEIEIKNQPTQVREDQPIESQKQSHSEMRMR